MIRKEINPVIDERHRYMIAMVMAGEMMTMKKIGFVPMRQHQWRLFRSDKVAKQVGN